MLDEITECIVEQNLQLHDAMVAEQIDEQIENETEVRKW